MEPIAKKKRKWRSRWLLLVIPIIMVGCYFVTRGDPPPLPEGPVTAYLIGGGLHFPANFEPDLPKFRSWPVIEQRLVNDPNVAKHVRAEIGNRFNFSVAGGYACFSPHLGFRFGEGKSAIDVVICVDCAQAYFYRGDSRIAVLALATLGEEHMKLLQDDTFLDDGQKIKEFESQLEQKLEAWDRAGISATQPAARGDSASHVAK